MGDRQEPHKIRLSTRQAARSSKKILLIYINKLAINLKAFGIDRIFISKCSALISWLEHLFK